MTLGWLHPIPVATNQFPVGGVGGELVTVQRDNAFMDRIENPVWLGEEIFLHLGSGSNPVSGSDYHGWGVQVIESELAQVVGDILHH